MRQADMFDAARPTGALVVFLKRLDLCLSHEPSLYLAVSPPDPFFFEGTPLRR